MRHLIKTPSVKQGSNPLVGIGSSTQLFQSAAKLAGYASNVRRFVVDNEEIYVAFIAKGYVGVPEISPDHSFKIRKISCGKSLVYFLGLWNTATGVFLAKYMLIPTSKKKIFFPFPVSTIGPEDIVVEL